MPKGISKTIYHPICLVCKKEFETRSHRARVCPSKQCKNASRYILYAEKYRTQYKTNPDHKQEEKLVDCVCPFCRKKHQKRGGDKWQFCREHEFLRYSELDTKSQEYRIRA